MRSKVRRWKENLSNGFAKWRETKGYGPSPMPQIDEEEQAEYTTCTGSIIEQLPKGLPKHVPSLCPECGAHIEARLFDEGGKVWMEKTCERHGYFRDLYWSDVDLYLKAERVHYGDERGFSNPNVTGASKCPESCGLCNMHISHTGLANIDLTNRCNLTCPICFANSNAQGFVFEPEYDVIVKMMRGLRAQRPAPATAVQFSGGEPTLHPRFLDVIHAANEVGFTHVQIATNGLKFVDLDFAKACADAGLHTLYLQLDGTDDKVYVQTRGRPLHETKLKALENVGKAGMKVVFVPTIVRGINDDQVGSILRLAIETEFVSGISYQPVAFTGRISHEERMRQRYTMPDLAHDIEKQTGLANAKEDWYPLACVAPMSRLVAALRGSPMVSLSCHPHCSLGTYLFIDDGGNATPITQFVDVEGMFRKINELSHRAEAIKRNAFSRIKEFNLLKRYFDESKAPEGLTFTMFLQTLEGLLYKDVGRAPEARTATYRALLVAAMHFMDGYNYELNRVRRCLIHYAAPNGRLYPFCSYNSGPAYREKIEAAFPGN